VTLKDETRICILVENEGTVPGEIRDRFFNKFITNGKRAGTGLGTYSAKLLTEAQNSRISLEVSGRDNLTTLTVTLPRYVDIIFSPWISAEPAAARSGHASSPGTRPDSFRAIASDTAKPP